MGTITTLSFHRDDFKLSPHMESFSIRHEFQRMVLVGQGKQADFDRFDVPLTPAQQGTARDIGDGDHMLQIRTGGDAINRTLLLSYINDAGPLKRSTPSTTPASSTNLKKPNIWAMRLILIWSARTAWNLKWPGASTI